MGDPVSITLVAAAIGGIASTITQSGSQWLSEKWKSHQPEVQRKAQENAQAMLDSLSIKVATLEEAGRINDRMFESAFDDPAFHQFLRKALLGSAETDNRLKRELLAELLVKRLQSDSESILTASASLVAETIVRCTPVHLHLLSCMSVERSYRRSFRANNHHNRVQLEESVAEWLNERVRPLSVPDFRTSDMWHLQSLNCIHTLEKIKDHDSRFVDSVRTQFYGLSGEFLASNEVAKSAVDFFDRTEAKLYGLTSLGDIIGTMVADEICGRDTDLLEYMSDRSGPTAITIGPYGVLITVELMPGQIYKQFLAARSQM